MFFKRSISFLVPGRVSSIAGENPRGETTPLPVIHLVYSGPLARPGVRVAVIVHLFYPELIDEIHDFLQNIQEPFDLFVTTPHESAISDIFNSFGSLAQTVSIALSENRGRDIGPFISIYRKKLLEPYDAVLKVHGKKSTYSRKGDSWRRRLFTDLCGDAIVVKRTLEMLRQGSVGIVGPQNDYLTHKRFWGGNKACVKNLLKAACENSSNDSTLGFFAGSMFWFKPEALSLLHNIQEDQLHFEPETGQQDGTLAHALERIFCDLARRKNYVVTSIDANGVDVGLMNTKKNTVPVLN